MTGWSKREIIGKSPRILQGEKTERKIFSDLRERLLQGDRWVGQTANYRKDGTEFIMEWSIVPIRDKSGEVYRYLAVQRDVTTRVNMERELAAAIAEERKWFQQLEETNRKLNELNLKQLRTLNLFTKYVPESVVEKSLAAHDGSLFHGERLEIVALFCDMRGFTSLSENLDPDTVVKMLNTYYAGMAEVIDSHTMVRLFSLSEMRFSLFLGPRCRLRIV
jgi:PAS domain S-box-containing protein